MKKRGFGKTPKKMAPMASMASMALSTVIASTQDTRIEIIENTESMRIPMLQETLIKTLLQRYARHALMGSINTTETKQSKIDFVRFRNKCEDFIFNFKCRYMNKNLEYKRDEITNEEKLVYTNGRIVTETKLVDIRESYKNEITTMTWILRVPVDMSEFEGDGSVVNEIIKRMMYEAYLEMFYR